MDLQYQSAVDFSLSDLSQLINRAFTGYVGGNVQLNPSTLATFLAADDVNLGLSVVAMRGSDPVGISLHARRSTMLRVALFGVTPESQGQGVGKLLLQHIREAAKARGEMFLTLEVIEQNPRGVKLYEGFGFKPLRRLMGYVGTNLQGEAALLREIPWDYAARRISAWSPSDLPWQCSGETVMKYTPPHIAYRMSEGDEASYAVISDPDAERIIIRGLAVPPEHQRKGIGTRLVSALIAAHPGKTWSVRPTCPEEYGALFTRNGFSPESINQFQMMMEI
jgi:GNAT superfamily N-acetyltransferase